MPQKGMTNKNATIVTDMYVSWIKMHWCQCHFAGSTLTWSQHGGGITISQVVYILGMSFFPESTKSGYRYQTTFSAGTPKAFHV